MYFQRVFAMIDDSGVVQNRAVFDDYETANQITRAVYGNGASAEECTRYNIGNGYLYIGGKFYLPDGITEAEYVPDYEEQAEALQDAMDTIVEDNVELDYRLSMQELGLNE